MTRDARERRHSASTRHESVDVLRGLTIAGMIVVNHPGTWSAVYPPLRHAQWHGWTLTDTIFPFFLFVVGVSISLSFAKRRAEGATSRALLLRTLARSAILIGLGLALNLAGFLAFHHPHFRVPGVLQRIGLCTLVAGLVLLGGGARGAAVAAGALLLGYWGLMMLVPVPGQGAGRLDPEGNLASYVDRSVFGAHTWKPGWDPEGLLSTLPAIATTLLGAVAGERLRASVPARRKMQELFAAGVIAAAAGLLWSGAVPINKNLWTSSYALFMAGLASASLAVCMWIMEVERWRRWASPFVWLGRNAIAAFVLSSLGAIVLFAIKVEGPDGRPRPLGTAVYRALFDRFADPRLGSLLFALAYLALWVAVFGVLHRKRVFLKI